MEVICEHSGSILAHLLAVVNSRKSVYKGLKVHLEVLFKFYIFNFSLNVLTWALYCSNLCGDISSGHSVSTL